MTRRVQSGDYPVLNFHMVKDLQEIGMWSKEIYAQIIAANGSILGLSEEGLSPEFKTRLRHLKEKYLMMWEIPQMIMIGLAAQRQVFIDQSQSFNVYIANPTIELLKRLHIYTHEMGLKTGMYYLHTRAPNQSLKLNASNASLKEMQTKKELPEVCKIGPNGDCIGCQ